MEKIKQRYMTFFEDMVDRALAGETVRINLGPAVLDLYLEGDMLHWRSVDGERTGNEGRPG